MKDTFGYPPQVVYYTGFPRFDNLHNCEVIRNRIVIMPTWRKWLKSKSEKNNILGNDIKSSDFMQKWLELLNSKELNELICKYNLDIIFYPHRAMQPYASLFSGINPFITVATYDKYDMQELMKSAQMMITDYSSVYFDMFYMKKPVIFYQFDEKDFRRYHYEEGWFDYHNNPFGKSYQCYRDVVKALEDYIDKNYQVSECFLKTHNQEFALFDRNNSSRIFRLINSKETADE